MRRAAVCAALLTLATAGPAAAALPAHGKLVPGRSLGGVRLGEPAAQVTRTLGSFRGVCRGCATTTWYFTYKPFDQHGLAVELTHGRVSGLFTLWQPDSWTGPNGIVLGAFEGDATSRAGSLAPAACTGYTAYTQDAGATQTVYYVVDGKLWGFGLFRRGASPCR
ncbi:MAG TPA: hypothetical protein VHD91_02950 [Gaiellaceae bacterium]|nr:hypothetical protein [Gaiellaceae bacterium]